MRAQYVHIFTIITKARAAKGIPGPTPNLLTLAAAHSLYLTPNWEVGHGLCLPVGLFPICELGVAVLIPVLWVMMKMK